MEEKIISDFKEQHGREPFTDELPGRHRVLESLDGQADSDGDELGDSSRLEENLAVYDGEDVPDTIDRLREIVAAMPEQWQKVYRLVLIEGRSKAEAGRIIGISDVRVGQLVRKINAAIAEDEVLKSFWIGLRICRFPFAYRGVRENDTALAERQVTEMALKHRIRINVTDENPGQESSKALTEGCR